MAPSMIPTFITDKIKSGSKVQFEHSVKERSNRVWEIDDARDCHEYVPDDVNNQRKEIERYKKSSSFRNWIRQHRLSNLATHKDNPEGYPAPRVKLLRKDNLLSTSESFKSAFNEILKAMRDDTVCTIAVWGVGGVGKTAMVKDVEERAREEQLYDQVIKVYVGETPNPEKIQDEIVYALKFERKDTTMTRAQELWSRLKDEKKILIILDGVWDSINLEDIGIFGEDHKGCKILLTTRCEQVCISMRIQTVIRFDILSNDEAYKLLKMNAGLTDSSPSDIQDEASKVAEKCQGLPIAVEELGRRLRDKALPLWKITSLKLKSPRILDDECFEALPRTYQCLRLSYNHLGKQTTQLCFLFCSLFPQDYTIDVEVLARYAWGLGLYESIDSIKKVRCEVWEAVENLISSGLLLDHGGTSVKMHSLVRHCALLIASQEDISFMTGPKLGLKEWQRVEDLPERFVGEELEILSLNGNGGQTVSCALMKGMKSLKVFTLRDEHLSTCAVLVNLTNIRTLHLVCCKLDDISLLGKLQSLEILSFRGSDIPELPDEIEGLIYLRLLDLLDCQMVQKVPLNLILKLPQLEELYFNCTSFEELWSEEESKEGSKARLSDMIPASSLSLKLQMYEITIKEDGSLGDQHNLTSRILRVTAISPDISKDLFTGKQPAVRQNAKELIVEDRTLRLSGSALEVEMIELPQLTCLWNSPTNHASLGSLKVVTIKNCQILTSLFSFSLARGMVSLEKLEIQGCHALAQIIADTYHLHLPKLMTLDINDCDKLQYVFGITTAQLFAPQLRTLKISRCPQLNRVVEVRQKDIKLPQLQKLALKELKSLTTFCSEDFSIALPSLEILEVQACTELLSIYEIIGGSKVKDLFLFNVGNQLCEGIIPFHGTYFLWSLVKLRLYELQVEWEDISQIVTFQNLSELIVIKCGKLKNIFSVVLARNLPQLKRLEVQHCDKLELVVARDQISSSMAGQKPVSFPNLEEICIEECENLKSLFPASVSPLDKLKKLELKDASKLREIFGHDSEATEDEKQIKEVSLPKLEELFLENLPKFIGFTTAGYHLVFPALTFLSVKDCHTMITTFSLDDCSKGLYVRAEIEAEKKSKLTKEGNLRQIIERRDDGSIEWHHPGKKPDTALRDKIMLDNDDLPKKKKRSPTTYKKFKKKTSEAKRIQFEGTYYISNDKTREVCNKVLEVREEMSQGTFVA